MRIIIERNFTTKIVDTKIVPTKPGEKVDYLELEEMLSNSLFTIIKKHKESVANKGKEDVPDILKPTALGVTKYGKG